MVVLGNSSRIRRAVFIVDASSALSGIFDLLLSEYVVPCIEYVRDSCNEEIKETTSRHPLLRALLDLCHLQIPEWRSVGREATVDAGSWWTCELTISHAHVVCCTFGVHSVRTVSTCVGSILVTESCVKRTVFDSSHVVFVRPVRFGGCEFFTVGYSSCMHLLPCDEWPSCVGAVPTKHQVRVGEDLRGRKVEGREYGQWMCKWVNRLTRYQQLVMQLIW